MASKSPEIAILEDQISTLRSGPTREGSTGSSYKIAVVGPSKSGKTHISNQLAGLPAPLPDKYEPTVGCRILEFSKRIRAQSRDRSRSAETNVDVELWDVSGEKKFEGCWLSVCHNIDGLIIVYNSSSREQANEVLYWCEWFLKNGRVPEDQIIIFAHGKAAGDTKTLRVNLGPRTFNLSVVSVLYSAPDPTISIALPGSGKDKSGGAGAGGDPHSAESQFANFLGGIYATKPSADTSIF